MWSSRKRQGKNMQHEEGEKAGEGGKLRQKYEQLIW